jgi:hypothetical protein
MAAESASTGSGANLGFEAKLFLTSDKLRGSMDASEYKHVALGLIFLKYISDAFNTVYEKLKADEYDDEEDAEEYLAECTFWVRKMCDGGFFRTTPNSPPQTISADRPRHSGKIFCVLLDYSVRKIASATMPVTRCQRHRIGK